MESAATGKEVDPRTVVNPPARSVDKDASQAGRPRALSAAHCSPSRVIGWEPSRAR